MALESVNRLPLAVASRGDVMRLRRELALLDDYINQAALRQPGTALKKLPKASASLAEFAELNRANLLSGQNRAALLSFLGELLDHGLEVRISFASEPSNAFMNKVSAWFRDNIDPLLLISIGLEPSIAAGCTLQTDSRFFDFSLRQRFIDQRGLLLSGIKEPAAPQG